MSRVIRDAYSEVPPVFAQCDGPSMAVQSACEECDVNRIVARAVESGSLPVSQRQGMFADVSRVGDYRSAVDRVMFVQEQFAKLPSAVRSEFGNDPQLLLDALIDPAQAPRMRTLGLLAPLPEPDPKPVPGSAAPASADSSG